MKTEYRTIKSKRELYETEKELKEKGFKRTFNSWTGQIWGKGMRENHEKVIIDFEY